MDLPSRIFVQTALCCFGLASFIIRAEPTPKFSSDVQATQLIDQAAGELAKDSNDKAADLLRSAQLLLRGQTSSATVKLWNEIGALHQEQLRLSEAEHDYRQAIRINRSLEQLDVSELATSLNNLGAIQEKLHSLVSAETEFRSALHFASQLPGGNSRLKGSILSNLGMNVQKQGRFQEAEQIYGEAFASLRRASSENSIEFARALRNFGLLQFEMGRYPQALTTARRVDGIERALPYVSTLDRALILNDIGLALFKLADLEGAEESFGEVLALNGIESTKYKHEYAQTLMNVALPEKARGRLLKAQGHLKQALDIVLNCAPVDGSMAANIWANLGGVALAQHHFREANQLYHRAADYWDNGNGASQISYAMVLSCLGTVEEKQGRHKRAGLLYSKALQIEEAALGSNHPQVAADLANLAVELYHQKQYDRAIQLSQQAVRIQDLAFGATSIETAHTWRQIGIVHIALKQYDEAAQDYRNAIRRYEVAAGNSPELISCLHEYAHLARMQQQFGEAEQAEVQAFGIQVRNSMKSANEHSPAMKVPLG